MQSSNEKLPKYLSKVRKISRVNLLLIMITIMFSFFIRGLINNIYVESIMGLSIFVLFITAPLGVILAWKSMKKREGYSKLRMRFFILNGLICAAMLLLFVGVISDVKGLI